MGPFAGVIDRPAEIFEALEARTVRCRQAADRHDTKLRAHLVTAVCLNAPALFNLVKSRRSHARVEHNVAAEIEAVGNVVGVGEDLRLWRVFL